MMTPIIMLAASACVHAQSFANVAKDPAIIKALAAEAYVWGLGPEYIDRFSKYNTIIGAPYNAFKYGSLPAAWNNEAPTPATRQFFTSADS